jgi:hypothetical protein
MGAQVQATGVKERQQAQSGLSVLVASTDVDAVCLGEHINNRYSNVC